MIEFIKKVKKKKQKHCENNLACKKERSLFILNFSKMEKRRKNMKKST